MSTLDIVLFSVMLIILTLILIRSILLRVELNKDMHKVRADEKKFKENLQKILEEDKNAN